MSNSGAQTVDSQEALQIQNNVSETIQTKQQYPSSEVSNNETMTVDKTPVNPDGLSTTTPPISTLGARPFIWKKENVASEEYPQTIDPVL